MKHVYFFTGFPGFISNQLIRELLSTDKSFSKLIAIVLPSQIEKAQNERSKVIQEFHLNEEQFQLLEGDITKPKLNLPENESGFNKEGITHVFHLAAIYDLAVAKQIAYSVNVDGTRNMNEFVESIQGLKRYTYFSTAYVAGKREGILYEDELIRPEEFKNFYEETKYEAEVLVRTLKTKVPITIIRPGIVKGSTLTGETTKFDGPYFILNFLDKIRFMPIIPYITKSECVINLVPVDYIIQATAYLSLDDKGIGKTYHLTDPKPYTVTEVYRMFTNMYNGKEPKGYIPFVLTKSLLKAKPIRKYFGVEVESLDYFTWKGYFDCTNTKQDLLGSGIRCPDFKDGVLPMIDYYRANKQRSEYHIEIT